MITALDFFGVYCATFEYIERTYGHEALEKYWAEYIADRFLAHLEALVAEKGIEGMKEYWGHTLAEEEAGYEITATEDSFRIDMHDCPALRWLREHDRMTYDDYCAHCPALYKRIMNRNGYSYQYEYDPGAGRCWIEIRAVTPARPLSNQGGAGG